MNAYFRWKYTVLLVAMISMLFARVTALAEALSGTVIDVGGAVLLVAALLTIADHRRFRAAALLLGIPAIVGTLASEFVSEPWARHALVFARASGALFLGFTIAMILRELMTQRHVTWDSIVGTFCGYMLIGAMWSEMYSLMMLLSPDALHFTLGPNDEILSTSSEWHHTQYFSFVTLSTVGYGDVTPVSPMARTLAMLEAVCGQFYLAVLVAALVGLRVSHRVASEERKD